MNNRELIKYLNSQINECKKILERTTDRALKAYYQGQIYAFELVLTQLETEKNPDCQEPNIFDEMLIHGGKLEGAHFEVITDRYDYHCNTLEAVEEAVNKAIKEGSSAYIIRYYVGDTFKGGYNLEELKEKLNEDEVTGLRLYQEQLDNEMQRKAAEFSKGLPEGFKMTADTIVNEDGMTAVRFSIEKEEK